MKISLFSYLPVDQNLIPSSCNQARSPWLFEQSVIEFQHTTILSCLHGSIVDTPIAVVIYTIIVIFPHIYLDFMSLK